MLPVFGEPSLYQILEEKDSYSAVFYSFGWVGGVGWGWGEGMLSHQDHMLRYISFCYCDFISASDFTFTC